jgi:hypothetical protein
VNIIKSIALASSLAFQSAWSPASAANVYGFGSIDTNLGSPLESFDAEYEDSDFLDVAKTIQLNGSQAGGNIPVGSKGLSYFGYARFGRLAATSHIGGQVPASPDLSTSVMVSMGFSDQITPQNLNPLAGNSLRLDVTLGGEMTGYGATDNGLSIGKLTSTNFSIRIADLDYTFVVGMADASRRTSAPISSALVATSTYRLARHMPRDHEVQHGSDRQCAPGRPERRPHSGRNVHRDIRI